MLNSVIKIYFLHFLFFGIIEAKREIYYARTIEKERNGTIQSNSK